MDILSVGYDDFNGQLKHNVSAHPKVDRKTGEMLTFGYNFEKPLIHYSLINKDGKVTNSLDIPISSIRMIHDFAVTENYVIFPDLPLEFRPDAALHDKFIFQFDENKTSKYGIMRRDNNDVSKIQWFYLPNHYVFHYVNAWEYKNDDGQTIIRMFGCVQNHIDIDLDHGEHPFAAGAQAPKLTKFEFNLSTGLPTMQVKEE